MVIASVMPGISLLPAGILGWSAAVLLSHRLGRRQRIQSAWLLGLGGAGIVLFGQECLLRCSRLIVELAEQIELVRGVGTGLIRVRARAERTLRTRTEALTRAQQAHSAAGTSTMDSVTSVLGGFLGGRRSVSSIGAAARRTQAAHARAQAADTKVDEVQAQIQDLEAELTAQLQGLHDEWMAKAANITPLAVALKRTQVRVTDLRLVWLPVG